MPWWAWLLTAWVTGAVVVGVTLARAIRLSEAHDWIRRGRPERRAVQRPDPEEQED
jgi:hypothetical protein